MVPSILPPIPDLELVAELVLVGGPRIPEQVFVLRETTLGAGRVPWLASLSLRLRSHGTFTVPWGTGLRVARRRRPTVLPWATMPGAPPLAEGKDTSSHLAVASVADGRSCRLSASLAKWSRGKTRRGTERSPIAAGRRLVPPSRVSRRPSIGRRHTGHQRIALPLPLFAVVEDFVPPPQLLGAADSVVDLMFTWPDKMFWVLSPLLPGRHFKVLKVGHRCRF